MKSPNIKYLPGVDHLRAAAAVLIVLYHGVQLFSARQLYDADFDPARWLYRRNPLWTPVLEGHTAVALFMVLSGFIFAFGARGGDVIYAKFLRNRIVRIFPLFIALLTLGVYCYPGQYTLRGVVQTVLFQANLPGAANGNAFTGMFWAITVEFQFYLLFPFLLRFTRLYGTRYLFGLIVLFTGARCLAYLSGANLRDLAYWTIVGRMDQFALGMAAGFWYADERPVRRGDGLRLAGALALAWATLYVFHRRGGWPAQHVWTLFWPTAEGAVWAAVILAYLPVSRRVPELASRALCWVGTRSFSVYLLHFALLQVLSAHYWYFRFPFSPIPSALANTLVLLLPVTLAASALTYSLIERPFLDLRQRYKAEPLDEASPAHNLPPRLPS